MTSEGADDETENKKVSLPSKKLKTLVNPISICEGQQTVHLPILS